MIYNSIHITFSKWQKYKDKTQISGCQRSDGKWKKRDTCDYKGVDSIRQIFVVMEQFCILIAVMVTGLSTGDKIAQDYTNTLYQYKFPDFDTVLKLYKM